MLDSTQHRKEKSHGDTSRFSTEDMKTLLYRFKQLDKDGSGEIDINEFMDIPNIRGNPLAKRLLCLFDTDNSGQVSFDEFVAGLSVFSSKGNAEEKLRFVFQVYDLDGDGYISSGELSILLKTMTGDTLPPVHLQQIIDKSIIEADKDKDGKLSFEEFKAILEKRNPNLAQKMTFNF